MDDPGSRSRLAVVDYPTVGRPEVGDVFWGGRVTAGHQPLGRRSRSVLAAVAALALLVGGWFGGRAALVPVAFSGASVQFGPTWVGVPVTTTFEFEAARIRVPAHLTSVTVPDVPAGVRVTLLGINDPTAAVFPELGGFPGDPRWHLSRVLVPLVGQRLTGDPIRVAEVITVDRPGSYTIAAPVFGWAAGPWRGHVVQGVTQQLTTATGHPDYDQSALGAPPTAGR